MRRSHDVFVCDQKGSSVRVLKSFYLWIVKTCHDLAESIVRMTSGIDYHLAFVTTIILSLIPFLFFVVIIGRFWWIVVVFFSGPDRFLSGCNVRQVSRFEEIQLFVILSVVLFVFVLLIKFPEPLFAVLEGLIRLFHMIGYRKYLLSWIFNYKHKHKIRMVPYVWTIDF